MAKRSTRIRKTRITDPALVDVFDEQPKSSWDPIDQRRDKKYIKRIKPRSQQQKTLMEEIDTHAITFAVGPAGTGKTYLAVAAAVEALEAGQVDRIVLTRPAIEAGEKLGFLPGDLTDKMDPYLRPLYDALGDRMGGKKVRQLMADGTIEIAPIGYMRGRTLNNCFVVIDEAQNCSYGQIKMLLTRLGWHSTMVLTGDPGQSDLLEGDSGLAPMTERVEQVDGIAVVHMTQSDVVRHPLVAEMLPLI
ncbi:MAG: PhoH family protein [Alphaproteobacteria bacterium]